MNDEQEIRQAIATWMSATRDGDTAKVLDLMTSDVVFLTPGREPFGKEAFADAAAAMGDAQVDGTNDVVELRVMGDHAYVRSNLAVTVTLASGKILRREGTGLTIFRKEHGSWRLARDASLLTEKA